MQIYQYKKIIQLPQSIKFDDPKKMDNFSRIVDKHKDFTLLVRDNKSYSTACASFNCRVLLCPDAAYGLGRLEKPFAPDLSCLSIIRTDKESTGESASKLMAYGPVEDWIDDGKRMKSLSDRLIRRVVRMNGRMGAFLAPKLLLHFIRMAQQRVERGVQLLCRSELIVSDRLHVHIMSSLLGLPHIVLDNSYGKNSTFIDSWPLDSFTYRSENVGDVVEKLESWRF